MGKHGSGCGRTTIVLKSDLFSGSEDGLKSGIAAFDVPILLLLSETAPLGLDLHRRRLNRAEYNAISSNSLALGSCRGLARTQTPTNTNYAPEFPTFGEIARVSLTEVQWKGLALGEPPC